MHVLINGTENKLFSSSLKDIRLTLDAARAKMPSVPKGTVPGVDACLIALLTGPFLAHLLDALNRPVGKIPNTKSVLPQDVHVFLNVLFLLHRHKCSPEDFFKELGFGAKSQYGTHPELSTREQRDLSTLSQWSFLLPHRRAPRWRLGRKSSVRQHSG